MGAWRRRSRMLLLMLAIGVVPIFTAPSAGQTTAERNTATNSPQAAAVMAYHQAIASGDLAAWKKTVVAELVKQFDGPGGPTFWRSVTEAPPPTDWEFLKLSVTGDMATLLLRAKLGGVQNQGMGTLKLEGKEWKVALVQFDAVK